MIHARKGELSSSKRRADTRGFTIIEVSLFLAISGLLLIIMLFGVGASQRNAEFRDSMQGIADFLNQQVNAIQAGVNTRKSLSCTANSATKQITSEVSSVPSNNVPAGQAGDCIFLGRVFYFDKSTWRATPEDGTATGIGIYGKDIIGLRNPVSNVANCNGGAGVLASHYMGYINSSFAKHCPQRANTGTSIDNPGVETAPSYIYKWNTKLLHNYGRSTIPSESYSDPIFGAEDGVEYYKARAFGIFRDPDNGNMFTAILYGDPSNSTLAPDVNAQFCFKGAANYYGAIYTGTKFSNDGENTISGNTNLVNLKIDDPSCGKWDDINIINP